MHYVYVLRSLRDGMLYTGPTSNIRRRLKEHQAGKVASTRHRRPLVLAFSESFETRKEALARENYFKTAEGGALKQRLAKEAAEAPPSAPAC